MSYHVVFESNNGGRTWTTFQDKEKLDDFLQNEERQEIVIAEGVTPGEAIRLCDTSLNNNLAELQMTSNFLKVLNELEKT